MNTDQTQLNRYALSQSTLIMSKDNMLPIRRALADMAKGIDPTHYLTFNFYADYSMTRAEKKMNLWYFQSGQRMHKRHPGELPENKAIPMIGYAEYTPSGLLHYHAAIRINPAYEKRFLEVAPARWKKIVKSGELHIRPFGQTEKDFEKAAVYSTKQKSSVEWFIPSDYHGSAFDASARATERLHSKFDLHPWSIL